MATRHEICPTAEIPPGERRIVEVDGLSIGVFNVDGEFYGLANVCPHQLAELCRGQIGAEVVSPAVGEYERRREGEIVRCPRHRWAFDIKTGESVFNPHLRTRSFDVEVESREGEADAESEHEGADEDCYGVDLAGDDPPVDTYDVEVEDEYVVVYV